MNSNDINSLLSNMMHSKECDGKIAASLFEKLNNEQKQQLSAALSDPQLLHKLLSSPEAQKIISKFSEKEKRE